jgi:hypothetical protein
MGRHAGNAGEAGSNKQTLKPERQNASAIWTKRSASRAPWADRIGDAVESAVDWRCSA